MDLKDLLNKLSGNIFIPATDLPAKLVDTWEVYLICAKSIDWLLVCT